jgi:hypothetical protein
VGDTFDPCLGLAVQFTSPEQLKGHLQGKPHKELLMSLMRKQGKLPPPGADGEHRTAQSPLTIGKPAPQRDRGGFGKASRMEHHGGGGHFAEDGRKKKGHRPKGHVPT